jgi:hypothetical protein
MGQVEIKDQIIGIKFLKNELKLGINMSNIGIFGWSYGKINKLKSFIKVVIWLLWFKFFN